MVSTAISSVRRTLYVCCTSSARIIYAARSTPAWSWCQLCYGLQCVSSSWEPCICNNALLQLRELSDSVRQVIQHVLLWARRIKLPAYLEVRHLWMLHLVCENLKQYRICLGQTCKFEHQIAECKNKVLLTRLYDYSQRVGRNFSGRISYTYTGYGRLAGCWDYTPSVSNSYECLCVLVVYLDKKHLAHGVS